MFHVQCEYCCVSFGLVTPALLTVKFVLLLCDLLYGFSSKQSVVGAYWLTAPIKVAAVSPPEASVLTSALYAPMRLAFCSYEDDCRNM